MFGLGAGEIIVVGIIALVFVGPKKLPELGRSMGRYFREFKNAKNDFMTQINTPETSEYLKNVEPKKDDRPFNVDFNPLADEVEKSKNISSATDDNRPPEDKPDEKSSEK